MATLLLLDQLTAKPNAGTDMTQYLAVCVGLIALVLCCGWGFKRLFARSLAARAAKRSLQVLLCSVELLILLKNHRQMQVGFEIVGISFELTPKGGRGARHISRR